MRFQRFGRSLQLVIDSIADLHDVLELDESLWMATSAPLAALSCDPEFLALVDANGNGRIHTQEIKAAVRWLLERLTADASKADAANPMPLNAIERQSADGETLAASARYVLNSAGTDSETVSIEQVRSFVAGVRERPLNGDGVIIPDAADDAELRQFIDDVAACMGATTDISGRQGITEADLNAFSAAVREYLAWRERGIIPEGNETTAIMPLGAQTPAAYHLLKQYSDKVDAFFELCAAVRFEPQTAQQANWWQAEAGDGLTAGRVRAMLEQAPPARPNADGELPLDEDKINPLYRGWIAKLKEQVLLPVLGEVPERLSQADWHRVEGFFQPFADYEAAKKGAQVEGLPLDRLAAYRDRDFDRRARELIAADREVAGMLQGIEKLKRLLLYRRHLVRLCNNFVGFPELYSSEKQAMFERGRAVIDGRWFNFSTSVDDVPGHSAVAKQGSVFTLYLEITGKDPASGAERKFTVVSPATSGTKGNLAVGKRGVFFDTEGTEYDARVISIIENPISVREAFTSPFVRLWQFIIGKIEALAGRSEKGLEERAANVIAAPQNPGQPAAAGQVVVPTTGMFVGLGVAFAALTSAFAYIVKTFSTLTGWQIGLGFAGLAVVVFVPIVLLAIIKLRRRDLAALLEGSGWAINARMRLNRAQRRHFTQRVPYPADASGTSRRRWGLIAFVAALVLAMALGAVAALNNNADAPADAKPAATQDQEPQQLLTDDPADSGSQ